MELDAIENADTRKELEQSIDWLSSAGICRVWATDLVIAIYLIGLREKNEIY
jgi:hypothetical protein